MRATRLAVLALSVAAGGAALAGAPPSAGAAGKISVTFLPAPPGPIGGVAVIPIRVANGLSRSLTEVTLVVTGPTWVRLSGPHCVFQPGRLRCALGRLAAGKGVTIRIRAKPKRSLDYRLVARASVPTPRSTSSISARSLAGLAPFRGLVSPISAALARRMRGVSWRAGCPVGLRDLRQLTVSFWGFDGLPHEGTLIVHRSVAQPVVAVLGRLYAARFPIRRMVPVDAYGGDDFRSIEADNTSAFNCRPVAGTSRWSQHAYGRAIDIDPIENPYVSGDTTVHRASRRYLDRSLRLPGMIHAGDAVVRAFAAEGWSWGGLWSGDRDYQHFSASGR